MKYFFLLALGLLPISVSAQQTTKDTLPAKPLALPTASWVRRTYTDTIRDSVYITCPRVCKVSFADGLSFLRYEGWIIFKVTKLRGDTGHITLKDTMPR